MTLPGMSSSKLPNQKKDVISAGKPPRGFALVVTLTLMILLSLLALALLSLSSVTLRQIAQGDPQRKANANARLALMMAIGQLQELAGDDRRVTFTGDQRRGSSDGATSAAKDGRGHWAGVYESWSPDSGVDPSAWPARPEPKFLGWLVSGGSERTNENLVETVASPEDVLLVGEGTTGPDASGFVKVKPVELVSGGKPTGRVAWWTSDQGVKASLGLRERVVPADVTEARTRTQAPSTMHLKGAEGQAGVTPFSGVDFCETRVASLTGWRQAELIGSDDVAVRSLFHDVAASSSGLLTNVREGGFRGDLSMRLEKRPERSEDNYYLYEINKDPGINLEELYHYYHLYEDLEPAGSFNYTTSGPSMPANARILKIAGNPSAAVADDAHNFKMPLVIGYELLLGFSVKPLDVEFTGADGKKEKKTIQALHLVADPILTFWNPLDVPVAIPNDSYVSFAYWQPPFDVDVTMGGKTWQCPLVGCLTQSDQNFLSIKIGNKGAPMVFRPGEIIKTSQTRDTIHMKNHDTNHNLQGEVGFNHGGGVAYPMRDTRNMEKDGNHYINVENKSTLTYKVRPNELTCGALSNSGKVLPGYTKQSYHHSLTMVTQTMGDDRGNNSEFFGGGAFLDSSLMHSRILGSGTRSGDRQRRKPASARYYADNPKLSEVFKEIDGRVIDIPPLSSEKQPFMMISFRAKTEEDSTGGGRGLWRLNPTNPIADFYDMGLRERALQSFEYHVEPVDSWKNHLLEVTPDGKGYFGGGYSAQAGTVAVVTHSVPREPIISLGALQHSMANGYDFFGVGARSDFRRAMYPAMSHPIGNSVAIPIIEPDKSWSTMAGGQVAADHSYLANRALWDDWYFSSIAGIGGRSQNQVAGDFLNGKEPLPNSRYFLDSGQRSDELLANWFDGTAPKDLAYRETAASLRVSGMFNVNSTSVEAWKAVLGSLKDSRPAVQERSGDAKVGAAADGIELAGLLTPIDEILDGDDSPDVLASAQWVGRRLLTPDQLDLLAKALVSEVRKRGPFLSLGDFVNRRLGTDRELAVSGALQSAIDAASSEVNKPFSGRMTSLSAQSNAALEFPDAEEGPKSLGIPGVVKQGDLLTSLAPFISVRSDSFLIRAYGESLDKNGNVVARAWCEAQLERDADFLDPADAAATKYADLTSEINKRMGRKFRVTGFRWLNSKEI